MQNSPHAAPNQKSWKSLVAETRPTWLSATLLGGALAFIVGLATARYWEATQAVVVRQDAAASNDRPGKFADLYEMRTVQETILELARSQQVVSATLAAVDNVASDALTPDDLDEFRSRFEMTPPGGAEFGKTEVFYLSVQDKDRARALRLVAELCEQLDLRLRALRGQQARGMIAEIQGQLTAAEEVLVAETDRLAQFETSVGADLGELRMLHSAWSGQSDLRQRYVNLGVEFRRAQEEVQEIERLLELLATTKDDPNQLASLPSSLLAAQPALRRLKEGLVDAQLRTSRLQGARSSEHPRVIAAVEAEESMRRDLVQEILAAQHATESELQLRKSRQAVAEARLRQAEARLAQLAEQRAEYSNLVAAAESSQASVDSLRGRLATAQALLAAAENSSVLNLVDAPETGPTPTGPSRAAMLLAGMLGGLTVGAGLIFYQQAPEVAYVAGPAPLEPNVEGHLPAATDPPPPPIREWWETQAVGESAQDPRETASGERFSPTESAASAGNRSAPSINNPPPTPPLHYENQPAQDSTGNEQAGAIDRGPSVAVQDEQLSEPVVEAAVTEKPSPVAPAVDPSNHDAGDRPRDEEQIAESPADEELRAADEATAEQDVDEEDRLASASEETTPDELNQDVEPSTVGDDEAPDEDEVARNESAVVEEVLVEEQQPASHEETVAAEEPEAADASDDEKQPPQSASTESTEASPETASSTVAAGLVTLGLDSADLKDAMRDAFLPTQ